MSVETKIQIMQNIFFTSTSVSMYRERLTHLDPFLSLLKRWLWGNVSVSRFSLIRTGIWSRIVSRTGHFQNKGLVKQPRWDIQRSANRQTCVFSSDHSPYSGLVRYAELERSQRNTLRFSSAQQHCRWTALSTTRDAIRVRPPLLKI